MEDGRWKMEDRRWKIEECKLKMNILDGRCVADGK